MIKMHAYMRQPVLKLSRITTRETMICSRSISTTVPRSQTVVQSLTVSELYRMLREEHFNDPFRKNLRLIDARERHEIESFGRIESAVNLPYGLFKNKDPIFSAALGDFDKDAKTVIHCMSGRRSEMVAQHAIELGFKNVYSLVGGFKEWQAEKLPVLPYENNHSPWVHTIFEKETETAQYIVTDVETKEAYIIDPVLDYDPFSATVRPSSAKKIIEFVTKYGLNVTKIIDTHVHADHLTAAIYLKENLPSKPQFWIGDNVKLVQQVFRDRYNLPEDQLPATGEQFDHLVEEGDTWMLGDNIHCSVLGTPGHTPACMSYRIGDAAFVGDTLFMPDIGTARCDFPGGSAEQMYKSVQKMYQSWPNDTRIFVGHDYPPTTSDRSYEVVTTLAAHKESNKMINKSVPMDKYIALRKERDSKLKPPRYIHPSLQTNLRGGNLPKAEKSRKGEILKDRFFKIPVRWQND